MLKLGDPAPAFTLTADDGKQITLGGFPGKRALIFFYPKANTSG